MWVGGGVVAEELRLWKGNGNKSIAKGHIFLRSFINSNVTAAFISRKKGIRCQQILKQQNMSYNHP